jgi:isoleucyl-tRNA synthetase
VSQVDVAAGGTTPAGSDPGTPIVHVEKADGIKCERCWRFVPEVSADPAVAGLCSRCVEALAPAVQH